MNKEHWDWLVNSIRYFREMDFFSQDKGLSDDDLAHQIVADEIERCREYSWTPFWARPDESQDFLAKDRPPTGEDWLDALYARMDRPRPDYKDLLLLAYDKSRIWWEDGEGDICPGDETYARTVQEWSCISRGVFQPTAIREVWYNPDGWSVGEPDCQVTIHFHLDGQERILEPGRGYGWIDFGLLNGINPLIADTGFAYEEWDAGVDQCICLVVLTIEEKRRLIAERGWEFSDIAGWGYGFRYR